MKIKLNQCYDDWFTIVRTEHDGKDWLEQVGPNSHQFMQSERLSPEACIEGPADEMIAIARAIKARRSVSFERCAVRFEDDGVHFCSPRHSQHDGVVTIEEADEFADQVIVELATDNEESK